MLEFSSKWFGFRAWLTTRIMQQVEDEMQWKAKVQSMQSSCWSSELLVHVSVVTKKSVGAMRTKEISNVAEQVFPVHKELVMVRQFHMGCSSLLLALDSKLMQSVRHVSESIVGIGEPIQKNQIIQQFYIDRQ